MAAFTVTRPSATANDRRDRRLARARVVVDRARPRLIWVDWFNHERPHESIDDLTPLQAEEVHYVAQNRLVPTG
jgi:hypothetical protein